VNVHVHNRAPETVIAYATKLGALSQISILNQDEEVRVHEADAGAPPVAPADEPPARAKQTAVVAVAPGDGLARAFEAAGAIVVRGGAAANPSTEELIRGIRRADGAGIVLLANHKNVVLVARQAAALSADRNVTVIETRNAAEGIAALLALDPHADVASNTERMREAAEAIQTLQVTRAVRDARVSGREVRQGEQIVLDPDEGVVASAHDPVTATLAGIETLRSGWELLTLYVGTGVDATAVDTLTRAISARYPDAAVELVDGGQPHYDLLIAAE
jgi:dihydroxyacetone kinase-like predicted kinase